MKITFFAKIILLLVIIATPSYSNVAMPGFFNTGGGSDFKPLNEKEYKSAQNIQMKKELIKIILFKGFAVVKGEYDMLNHTHKDINVTSSFPKNSFFKNKINISFDNLYNLKVIINDEQKRVIEKEQWFEWNTTFKANSITKIYVYYMVNTNNAYLREGYDNSKDNGFSYILETGKPWKDKIESGKIYIKLMDNLSINDIYGALPENILYNNNTLLYSFKNLEPEPVNNIVIRYKKYNENFNFKDYLKNSEKYYIDIDKEIYNQNTQSFSKLDKNNFSPPNYSTLFFLGIIIIICLIIFLPIILIIWYIIKKLRKIK